MATKSVGHKSKWLIIGVVFGMFFTIFIPEVITRNRLKSNQNSNFHHVINGYKFTEYSQWPPFLTDASFDLSSWRKHCWTNQMSLPTQNPDLYYKKNYTAYTICK